MNRRLQITGLILSALVAGCATQQQVVQEHEDLLAAAGFTARPANTPERQQALQTLPHNQFVRRPHGSEFVYLYADPLVCDCLYIGNQSAYDRYQREVLQRNIAQQNVTAAEMNANTAWNWGFWGPGWWYQ